MPRYKVCPPCNLDEVDILSFEVDIQFKNIHFLAAACSMMHFPTRSELALGASFVVYQVVSAPSAVAVPPYLALLSAVCVSGPQGQVNDVSSKRPPIPRRIQRTRFTVWHIYS